MSLIQNWVCFDSRPGIIFIFTFHFPSTFSMVKNSQAPSILPNPVYQHVDPAVGSAQKSHLNPQGTFGKCPERFLLARLSQLKPCAELTVNLCYTSCRSDVRIFKSGLEEFGFGSLGGLCTHRLKEPACVCVWRVLFGLAALDGI